MTGQTPGFFLCLRGGEVGTQGSRLVEHRGQNPRRLLDLTEPEDQAEDPRAVIILHVYLLLDVSLCDPAEMPYKILITLCEVDTQRTNNSIIGKKLPEYSKSFYIADILFISWIFISNFGILCPEHHRFGEA